MRVMRGSELAIDEVWPEKVQGWRKGAGSKIAVGPPIPIYIASDRIPSQHVGVGLAQARPNYLYSPVSRVRKYCLGWTDETRRREA